LEQRNRDSFAEVARRLDAIEARLTNLEAREERMVTEARAVATTAASVAASAHVADPARAMDALEERVRQMGAPALPAPTRRRSK
jgi:SRSO17 transposase